MALSFGHLRVSVTCILQDTYLLADIIESIRVRLLRSISYNNKTRCILQFDKHLAIQYSLMTSLREASDQSFIYYYCLCLAIYTKVYVS